jgi:hypothetical protein
MSPLQGLQPAMRVQFREGASNRVDTPFLQATTFEHEHEAPCEGVQPRGPGCNLDLAQYSHTPISSSLYVAEIENISFRISLVISG